MKRQAVAVTLAAAVAALAGCGGSGTLSKDEYEQKLQSAGQSLKDAFQGIQGNPDNLDELATQVGKAQDAVKEAADDLDSANPPEDAQADNDKLVAALRELDEQLGRLKTAADKGDTKAAADVSNDLDASGALQEADKATEDLKQKGYEVGVFGQ
jgi:chromosome segregation ATPase